MSVNKSVFGFPPQADILTLAGTGPTVTVPWRANFRAYLVGFDVGGDVAGSGNVVMSGVTPYINDTTTRLTYTYPVKGDGMQPFRPAMPVKFMGSSGGFGTQSGTLSIQIANNTNANLRYFVYVMYLPEPGAVAELEPTYGGGGG